MQEDTESFNENSNSEVIILPQNSHLEETLISDEEEPESEASSHSYDAKLNEKLKDLGLYEDGMTIQQKEELLAVVAVSFKTAEEEKSRRRWYEEYANAALAFPDDEIEFCFQQSPESELPTKTSCYTGDYEENTSDSKKNACCEVEGKPDSAVAECSNSDEYQCLPSTSQVTSYKSKSHSRKSRSRGESGTSYKLTLEEGNTVTSHSSEVALSSKDALLSINKQKKRFLEKSMSRWRPCLSPKDEPLICSRRPIPDEMEDSHPKSKPKQSHHDFSQDFNFALTEIKHASKSAPYFEKPYHLSRSGHCIKKAAKLDSFDIMVGVQENKNEASSDSGVLNFSSLKKEPFSRTSRGAFRYAQLHRDRIDALRINSAVVNNHTSSMAACSSSRYSIRKGSDNCRSYPEIVVEDGLETADIPLPDNFDSNASDNMLHSNNTSESFDCEDDVKNIYDTKLPKFSNLRPDLCRDSLSEKDILSRHISLTYNTMNCSEGSAACSTYRRENHIDSSSQDGDYSDSSSVIDVETIVDDEIEEFVLKRKLLQEPTVSDKQTYSNRPKRLKKNT